MQGNPGLRLRCQLSTNVLGVFSAHDALRELAGFDERKSRIVELRFFGGLSVEETDEVLKVSIETVMRDWKLAKAWLRRELRRG